MIRSFLNTYTADLGRENSQRRHLLLKLPKSKYPGLEAQTSFFDRLITRLEAMPGVESIAIADTLPTWGTRRFPYRAGRRSDRAMSCNAQRFRHLVISPSYFRTLGATLLSGREFNAADGISSEFP